MKTCDVSVIVRTCARPRLLGRALASIAAQTILPEEVMVVNVGGEAEPVQQVVAEQGAGLSVSMVDHPAGKSRGSALNAGLHLTGSRWFAVLDDDDTWLPPFLETMTAAAQGNLPVACQSYVVEEEVDAGGKPHETGRRPFNADFTHFSLVDLAGQNEFTINALLCPLEAWRKLGGYREDLEALEDWEFNLRLAVRYEITVLPQPLACYHRRPGKEAGAQANSPAATHEAVRDRLCNEWLRTDLQSGRFGLGWLSLLGRQNWELRQLPLVGRLRRWRKGWHRVTGRLGR